MTLPQQILESAVGSLPKNSLAPLRREALARFVQTGFPTTRDEDWKYTDLSPLVKLSQQWLERKVTAPTTADLDRQIAGLTAAYDADWLVIANGNVITNRFPRDGSPGVRVERLGDSDAGLTFDKPLADFNAALLSDGLNIRIDADANVARPIGLLVIDSAAAAPQVSQSRIRIEIGPRASARIFEYHASVGTSAHYHNGVVELGIAAGGAADYVRLQDRQPGHNHTCRTAVALSADSELRYCGFDLGGQLIRNDLEIDITGRGAAATVDGLYLASDGQHIDNHVRIDHRTGPARSAQQYRGILSGKCRCVWNGKAIVHAGADGTDAEQANHNLLLTEQAEIDAKPELEIYADDVKCSHGTTVGQLDDDALFYLRSRGLDERTAMRALTRAFAAHIVGRLPIAVLADPIDALVEARLGALTGSRLS